MGPDRFMDYLDANFRMTRSERCLIENILGYASRFEDEGIAHEFLSEMLEGTIGISDREVKMFNADDVEEKNTRIEYLYRDAYNYKKWNFAVIPGTVSPEQVQTILDCLKDGEYFIPHLVGLPEEKFEFFDPESDGDYFELGQYSFGETTLAPTEIITPDELVQSFLEWNGKWDDAVTYACNEKCDECEHLDTCVRNKDWSDA